MHNRKIKGKIKNRVSKPSARSNKRNMTKREKLIRKNVEFLRSYSSVRSRIPACHAGDTGSNPVGTAK